MVIYLFWEGWEGQREREREDPKQSPHCQRRAQCRARSHDLTNQVRSWPEPKSRVGCLTHSVTQVPRDSVLISSSTTVLSAGTTVGQWCPWRKSMTPICNKSVHVGYSNSLPSAIHAQVWRWRRTVQLLLLSRRYYSVLFVLLYLVHIFANTTLLLSPQAIQLKWDHLFS